MKKSIKRTLIWAPVSLIILLIVALIAFPAILTHSMMDKKVTYDQMWNTSDYGVSADTLTLITNDNYHIRVYEVSPEQPKAVIICLTGIEKPSVTGFYGHSEMFYNQGYATLLVDVRGHGDSDGDKICMGYQESRDVKAVTDYIDEKPEYEGLPVIALGLSMGAGIAINSIGTNDDIDALISISAFSSYEDMFVEFMSTQAPKWLSETFKPFIPISMSFKYGVNPYKMRPKMQIRHLNGRPALLMHSTQDSNVSYQNFLRIMQNAPATVDTMTRNLDAHFFAENLFHPQTDTAYCQKINEFISKAILDKGLE